MNPGAGARELGFRLPSGAGRAWRPLRWLAFAAVAFALAPTGSAAADGSGIPTFNGVVVDYGQALAFVGTISWGGAFSAAGNGSQVYASTVVVVLYDLLQTPLTMVVSLRDSGTTSTHTTTVEPGAADVVYVDMHQDASWHEVELVMGGTPQWFSVATPISLLPGSVDNVGGIDLLVLAVVSESVVAFAAIVVTARLLMKRAMWAPKFSLLIWGHVILIGLASAVIVDFQAVDQTFAGWSPLVYVAAVSPMVFGFCLSLFNNAPSALLLRANAPLSGRLSYTAWTIRTGRDARGRYVLVDESWRGFWARVFGHHVVLVPEEASVTQPEPFVADVEHRRVMERRRWVRRVRRPSPSKSSPLDDFDLIPASPNGKPTSVDDRPTKLLWTPVGQPVDVVWPRLSLHRQERVEARLGPGGEELEPARTVTRWALPHYTDGSSNIKLHDIHYRSQQSVVFGWRSAEDLGQVLSDTALDLESLKANFDTTVAKRVAERLTAREALVSRGFDDMDEDEAAQEAELTKHDLPPLDELMSRRGTLGADVDPARKRRGR